MMRFPRLITGIMLTASIVHASRAITGAVVIPDGVYAGESSTIRIKAVIPQDHDLIPEGVNVIRIDSAGRGVAVLGRMYDDGTHGDETASDGVFTGTLTMSPTEKDDIDLKVSVPYRGTLLRVMSPVVHVAVMARPTIDAIAEVLAFHESVAAQYENDRRAWNDNQARARALATFSASQLVAGAGISVDYRSIWVNYRLGISGAIAGNPTGTRGGSVERRVESNRAGAGTVLSVDDDTENRAIVLAPFEHQFAPNDESDNVAGLLHRSCGAVVEKFTDKEVTTSLMKTLADYRVLAVASHGIVDGRGQVTIGTGERASSQAIADQFVDFVQRRVQITSVSGRTFFFITPAFVSYYLPQMAGTVVYVSACLTFGPDGLNTTLADAFLSSGATVFFGWKESVSIEFAHSTGVSLFQTLANGTLAESGRSAGSAYSALSATVDPSAPNATFLYSGDSTVAVRCRSVEPPALSID